MVEFVIPINLNELLNTPQGIQYYVTDIIEKSECETKLDNLASDFQENGIKAIGQYFDVFYSLLIHDDKLENIEFLKYVIDFRRVFEEIDLPLEDDLNAGERKELLNYFQMICYIFCEMVQYLEVKYEEIAMKAKVDNLHKKREKQKTSEFENKWQDERQNILRMFLRFFQKPIESLWAPKKPGEDFTNIFSSLLIQILRYEKIKNEKEVIEIITDLYGILTSRFTKGISFLYQIVELVKKKEHAVPIVANIVYVVVTKYKSTSILKKITEDLTQWQMGTGENRSDSDTSAAKNCSVLLSQLTNLMSELMLPIIRNSFETFLHSSSYHFRIGILCMITDIILKILTGDHLTDDEKNTRNTLFNFLLDHTMDVTSFVRSKALQLLLKLQVNGATPLFIYFTVFKKALSRLRDKTIMVRRNAISLICGLIETNPFGADLNLDKVELKLKEIEKKLSNLNNDDTEWNKYEHDIQIFLKEKFSSDPLFLNVDNDNENTDSESNIIDESKLSQCIKQGDFDTLVKCLKFFKLKNKTDLYTNSMSNDKQLSYLLVTLKQMFLNSNNVNGSIEEVTLLYKEKDYNEDIKKLSTLISAVSENLEKQMFSVSDNISIASCEFFEIIYNFNVKNAINGIIKMLDVMYTASDEEKKCIYGIYNRIFFSSEDERKNTEEIVNNLISLVKQLSINQLKALSEILRHLMGTEEIDANVLTHLWNLFMNISGNEDFETRDLALRIITILAESNPLIIKKNIEILIKYGFREIGANDLQIMTDVCKAFLILAPSNGEPTETQNKEPNIPFFIPIENEFWNLLTSIFLDSFDLNSPYYISFTQAAIEMIYKLCGQPHLYTNQMFTKLREEKLSLINGSCNKLTQTIYLLGQLSYWNFSYLDNFMYLEIKKRSNNRRSKRSNRDLNLTVGAETTAHSLLEMADIEVINRILDRYLVNEHSKNFLSAFIPLIKRILMERETTFNSERLQCVTALTLISYMLISREFCSKHLQLLMTVLRQSKFESVKLNIIHGFSDLLNRFPNVVEPWLDYVQKQLKEGTPNVRKTDLIILQSLTLRESIRAKTCIAEIARTLDDNDEDIAALTRQFFKELSDKTNHLHTVIPEIISKLSDFNVTKQQFEKIVSFVFSLIQKDRHIDSLIENLCRRLENIENEVQCRSIVYCLSLFHYNEKRIEKLKDLFFCYKNKLNDSEIYGVFMNIAREYEKTLKKGESSICLQDFRELLTNVPRTDEVETIENNGSNQTVINNEKVNGNNDENDTQSTRSSETFKVPKKISRKRRR